MADQNLDMLIRVLTEGIDKATADIAKLKAEIASSPKNGAQLEMFRGVVEGMEKENEAFNKRKMAAVDQAYGQAIQRDAAIAEKAVRAEIKALEDFEKAKAKQIATFQKGESDLVEAMARGREASERRSAAVAAEMAAAQKAAIATAAQAKAKKELAERTKEVAKEEESRKDKLGEAIRANVVDEQSTKAGTKAKVDYREALKGVALELPHVGQALRLLTSPLSLLGAAAGVSITQIVSLLDHLDEVERLTRSFGTKPAPFIFALSFTA